MAKAAAKTPPAVEEAAPRAKAVYLPERLRHDQIVADPDNARKDFDAGELASLAETLFSHGLKQPPRCLPGDAHGKHQLIMGERRWRAWGLLIEQGRWPADHAELVLIEDADELERLEAGLIENLQRQDLNHMEAGLGFELLATRCKRSNKEIAEALGRSPEYIQQHRRLAQLAEDDQARVREGRLSMHDALRVLSQPKEVTFDDLSPAEQLLLAEVIDHCRTSGDKRYYNADRAEVSYQAAEDKVLRKLIERRLLDFTEKDSSTKKAYVAPSYAVRNIADGPLKVLGPKDGKGAIALLRTLRIKASGYNPLAEDSPPMPAVQDTPYSTPWLNKPFELSQKAAAELAKDKADKIKERDRAKAEKAKRAAYCEEANTLSAEIEAAARPAVDDRLPDLFRRGKITLPVRVERNRIIDAKGETVGDANWRFGDHQEAICLAMALAINAATGWGRTADPEAPAADPDADISPALKRLAGIPADAASSAENIDA